MTVNNLNQVVILIDADFLFKKVQENYEFYRDLYPSKTFQDLNMANLIDMIAKNGRVCEKGHKVDVIFHFDLCNNLHQPDTLLEYTNFTNNDYICETDTANFYIRSYFSDPSYNRASCSDEEYEFHYMDNFSYIFNRVAQTESVTQIILVADNALLNESINNCLRTTDKLLFIERDNSFETTLMLDYTYAGSTLFFIDINYVIAFALGLNESEI